jgi:hypothetical protein
MDADSAGLRTENLAELVREIFGPCSPECHYRRENGAATLRKE